MDHRNWKVWHKEEKRWLDYLVMLSSGRVGEIADDGSVVCLKDDLVDVVFQTGLKDKNGKEVYEGDVIEYTTGMKDINTFQTHHQEVKFETFKHHGEFELAGFTIPYSASHVEIIGNIYESPSLLEKV